MLFGVLEAFWGLCCVQCGVARSSGGLLGLGLCAVRCLLGVLETFWAFCCVQCVVAGSCGGLLGLVLCAVRCCQEIWRPSGPCAVCSAVLLGVLKAFWALCCVQCDIVRSSGGLLGLVLCAVRCCQELWRPSGPSVVCSVVFLGVPEAFWALCCVECGVVRGSEGLLGLVLCEVRCS